MADSSRKNLMLSDSRPQRDYAPSENNAPSQKFFRYGAVLLLAYLTLFAFEGPVRYLLSMIGAASALYLRDVVLFALVISGIFFLLSSKISLLGAFGITAFFTAFHFAVGYSGDVSLFAGIFAIKMLLPLMVGMLVAEELNRHKMLLYKWILFIWIVSLAGVMLNKFAGTFPWEGGEFASIFGQRRISKVWLTGGDPRLAGFTRASYDAAMIIGLTGLALAVSLSRLLHITVVLALTMVGVFLTTTKGMLLALIAGALVILWTKLTERKLFFTFSVVSIFFIASIALPVITLAYPVRSTGVSDFPDFLTSFVDRIVFMWPLSFSAIDSVSSYFLGNGLGSIGTPQRMFFSSREASSYADNIFVYFYVSFGLLSLIYLSIILWKTTGSKTAYELNGLPIITGATVFSYGITGNMIEQPYMAAFIGLSLGLTTAGTRCSAR